MYMSRISLKTKDELEPEVVPESQCRINSFFLLGVYSKLLLLLLYVFQNMTAIQKKGKHGTDFMI